MKPQGFSINKNRIGLRDGDKLIPLTITHQEGLSAKWCACGFSVADSGTGASDRVEAEFSAHECPLKADQ